MNDYTLNIDYLIREFKKATDFIINDRDTWDTPGIAAWHQRQQYVGVMLIATGHTVNYKTGGVTYTRKPSTKINNEEPTPTVGDS